jgi:hypothetical protein
MSFISDVGVPSDLIMDNYLEQSGKEWKKIETVHHIR